MAKKRSIDNNEGASNNDKVDDNEPSNINGSVKKVKKSKEFDRVQRTLKNAVETLQEQGLIDEGDPIISCAMDDEALRMPYSFNKSRWVEQWTLGFGLSTLEEDVQFKGKPVAKHTWCEIYKVNTKDPKELLKDDGTRRSIFSDSFPSHILVATNTTSKYHCVSWLIPIILDTAKFNLYVSTNGKEGNYNFSICVKSDPIDPIYREIQNHLYNYGAVPIRSGRQQAQSGASSIWPLCIGSNNRMTIRDRPMTIYLLNQRATILLKLLDIIRSRKFKGCTSTNMNFETFWILAYTVLEGIIGDPQCSANIYDDNVQDIYREFFSLRTYYERTTHSYNNGDKCDSDGGDSNNNKDNGDSNNNNGNNGNSAGLCQLKCPNLLEVLIESQENQCWSKLPKDIWTLIGRLSCNNFDTHKRLQSQKIQFYRTNLCTYSEWIPLSAYTNHFTREQCLIQTYFEGLEYLLDIVIQEETTALHNLSDEDRKRMKLSPDLVGALDVTSRFAIVKLILQNIMHNYCGKLAYAMYSLVMHPTAFKFAHNVFNIADGSFNLDSISNSNSNSNLQSGQFLTSVADLYDLNGPLHFIFTIITCMAMDHPVTMTYFHKSFSNGNYNSNVVNTSGATFVGFTFQEHLLRHRRNYSSNFVSGDQSFSYYQQLPIFRECIQVINELHEIVPNVPNAGKYLLEIYRLMRISSDMRSAAYFTDNNSKNSNLNWHLHTSMYHVRKDATVVLPPAPTKLLCNPDGCCAHRLPLQSHVDFVRQWLTRFYAIEDAKIGAKNNDYKYTSLPRDHFDIREHFENNIKPRSAI